MRAIRPLRAIRYRRRFPATWGVDLHGAARLGSARQRGAPPGRPRHGSAGPGAARQGEDLQQKAPTPGASIRRGEGSDFKEHGTR